MPGTAANRNDLDDRLQAALREMDDIMKVTFEDGIDDEDSYCDQVKTYTEDLCRLLSLTQNGQLALSKIPADKSQMLLDWLMSSGSSETSSNEKTIESNGNGFQMMNETGYETDQSSLRKINDTNSDIEQQNQRLKVQLRQLQKQYQESSGKIRETENRLVAENQKLMKAEERLHQEQVNKTYMESHKLDLMAEVSELRLRLQALENEKMDYRDRYEGLQNQVLEMHEQLIIKNKEINELKLRTRNGIHQNGGHHPSDMEVESLKQALRELMIASEEKDRKIMELRKAVNTYQKVEDIILQTQRPTSSDTESVVSVHNNRPGEKPPTATSTPFMNGFHNGKQNGVTQDSTVAVSPTITNDDNIKRSNSYDASRFHKVIMGTQTPLLNQRKEVRLTEETEETSEDEDQSPENREHKKKKGFKKFFSRSSKLKKSSSQEGLDELHDTHFKRGGVRSTATARLTGVKVRRADGPNEPRTPFHQWDSEQVAHWLTDMGLQVYASECLRWSKNGRYILDATQHEVDKELKICNPLHRKKLHLALEAERSGSKKDKMILNLRTDWVSKWLDDIGLPQYKDQFHEARVDGRMLNYITVEDLLYMKITSVLHHACIRRGIEVLRMNDFDLSSLKRRPASTSSETGQPEHRTPTDAHLWTNHRVMEWLRSIDLSEYAANLRGSGVHGALILLEPRFTVDNLAAILNIPASKTLLRRHLTAHFVSLVGEEAMKQKTACEMNSLSIGMNSKVKNKKSNLFKKGKTNQDYLCPITLEPIDSKAEDKRIKDAVAQYKKELSKNKLDEK